MSKKLKKLLVLLTLLLVSSSFQILSALPAKAKAEETKAVCAVYFTGIGCPHCAKTDPFLFERVLKEKPNLVIIEYEIYRERENGPLIEYYNRNYGSGLGIPLIIFGKNDFIIGDFPIIEKVENKIQDYNPCPLLKVQKINNKEVSFAEIKDFEETDLTQLLGNPKIWYRDRVLIKKETQKNSSTWILQFNNKSMKEFLERNKQQTTEKVPAEMLSHLLKNPTLLANYSFKFVDPEDVALSGKSLSFDYAVIFSVTHLQEKEEVKEKLTLAKIFSLAVVDSVNPCAIAVLALMLLTIIVYNPGNRKKILLAGLAFIVTVYVMYLAYGLILINIFKLMQFLTATKLYLYKALGVVAMLFGLLNIKDFVKYKPGTIGTEMPLSLRPKVKKVISKITSPLGAFAVGAFVTIFLLPCTIGPYIVATGILSALQLLKTMPYLLFYNFIFVLPMLIITLLVYFGFAKVEDINKWKERNIKKLHLVAGAIMFGLGVAMVSGLA